MQAMIVMLIRNNGAIMTHLNSLIITRLSVLPGDASDSENSVARGRQQVTPENTEKIVPSVSGRQDSGGSVAPADTELGKRQRGVSSE